jgi:hypothetical protein
VYLWWQNIPRKDFPWTKAFFDQVVWVFCVIVIVSTERRPISHCEHFEVCRGVQVLTRALVHTQLHGVQRVKDVQDKYKSTKTRKKHAIYYLLNRVNTFLFIVCLADKQIYMNSSGSFRVIYVLGSIYIIFHRIFNYTFNIYFW